jgi:hypothetical protein
MDVLFSIRRIYWASKIRFMSRATVALTGKPYSAKLAVNETQIQELRQKHGSLEQWWKDRFGHTFDSLTQSEARYLARSENADTIRDRIIAAEQAGNS